jgi:hypothetical protein
MSLYNTLFGFNPASRILLGMIGLTPADIPRFRDVFLRDNMIVIYTRTGGANRKEYAKHNARLRGKKYFLGDEDDSFNNTFAYFNYSIPPEYAGTCEMLRKGGADRDPRKEMERLLAKIKDPALANDPEVLAAMEKMRPTMEKLQAAFEGKGDGTNIIEI